MLRLLTLMCLIGHGIALLAQNPQDAAIPLQLNAGLNPPATFLSWPNPQPSDILLRRRIKGEPGNSWITIVSASQTQLNGYFDNGLDGSKVYEYALERKTADVTAYGYAYANFFTPVVDSRGKLLVFIDSTTADALGADLVDYKNDLRGEGWEIVPFKTGPFTAVQWVKNQIINAYNADPSGVKAVLLIGAVPVPYSGSIARDNKPDHAGAWPCDAYYGDIDGIWTDQTVNVVNTARQANQNVPGDGKFDQNVLPSGVELPVGRLDFSHLNPNTFGATPVELLRRYFFKNRQWRNGLYKTPNSALVDDHLGWSGGEAFAANGYRNAYPLTGENGVVAGDFLHHQRHLMRYGAGINGTYTSAGGIGNSAAFATDSVQSVVVSLFGDYFGDWDFENDPLLPALLASKGGVLAVNWAGHPHWMEQGLATGETMGYCLVETQNAQFNDAYGSSLGESGTHVALLGDPTLRARIVPPAQDVTARSNCNRVSLDWNPSPDPEVSAYLVYRAFHQDGPYTRMTPDLLFQTSWEDMNPVVDTLFYSVRAVKLEVLPGGGAFYNSSTGAPKRVIFEPGQGPAAIGLGGTLNCNTPSLTLGVNFSPPTSTYQWYKPDGSALPGFTATEAGIYTVVVTAPNGCTTAAYATVYMDTLLPIPVLPSQVLQNCYTPNPTFTVPNAPGNITYFFNSVEVIPGQQVAVNAPGIFTVTSASNGCSDQYVIGVQTDFTPPGADILDNGLVLGCNTTSVQLTAQGNNVQTYAWSQPGGPVFSFSSTITLTQPGTYCVTLTGANGCTSTDCTAVSETASVLSVLFSIQGNPCNDDPKTIIAEVTGGVEPYNYLWSTGGTDREEIIPAQFSGPLSVTVTDQSSCVVSTSILISPPLSVLALADEESSPGAADGYIDLLVLNGVPPVTFQWSNGSTTEDISGLTNGQYSVTVSTGNGCSTVLTILLTTVHTLEPEMSISVSPNPVSNQLTIRILPIVTGNLRLSLFDQAGSLKMAGTFSGSVHQMNIQALPAGIYYLWVESKTERWVQKVVVIP